MATHLPHAELGEFCMAGRGRNKLHMRKKKACARQAEGGGSDAVDSPGASVAEEELPDSPVSRV